MQQISHFHWRAVYIEQFEKAQKEDLVEEWSKTFTGGCLDARLESAGGYLESRIKPEMPINIGMEVFVSEFIKDLAEEEWLRGVYDFKSFSTLLTQYTEALAAIRNGKNYQMTHTHERGVVLTPKDIARVNEKLEMLEKFLDAEKAAKFIMRAHPGYIFSEDKTKITKKFVKKYLIEMLGFTGSIPSVENKSKSQRSHQIMFQSLGVPEQNNSNTKEMRSTQEKVTVEKEIVAPVEKKKQVGHTEKIEHQNDETHSPPKIVGPR